MILSKAELVLVKELVFFFVFFLKNSGNLLYVSLPNGVENNVNIDMVG